MLLSCPALIIKKCGHFTCRCWPTTLQKILPALFPVYTLLEDLAMRMWRFLELWKALPTRLCDLLKFFENTVLTGGLVVWNIDYSILSGMWDSGFLNDLGRGRFHCMFQCCAQCVWGSGKSRVILAVMGFLPAVHGERKRILGLLI
jgi:hypothetical protein